MPEATTYLTGQHLNLPEWEVVLKCPACTEVGKTKVKYQTVHLGQSFAACFICCFICCQIIQSESARDRSRHWAGDYNHFCSKCGCFLGRAVRFLKREQEPRYLEERRSSNQSQLSE